MLKLVKTAWEIVCFISEMFAVMFSDEESRQYEYDMGCGEIDK